jgi:hypothetical protein
LSEFLHRTRLSVSPSASLSMCPYAAGTLSSAASAKCPMHRAGGGGGDGGRPATVRPRVGPGASPQTNNVDKQGGEGGSLSLFSPLGAKREREPRAAGARTRSPGRRMSSGVGETLNVLNGDVANVRETVNDAAAKSRLRYFDGFTWRTGH